MDRHPNLPEAYHNINNPSSQRRRSHSQPATSIPGPSNRPPEVFDYFSTFEGPSTSTALPPFPPLGPEFEEDAIFRSLLVMPDDTHGPQTQHPLPSLPQHLPPIQTTHIVNQAQNAQMSNPLLSQTFMAWLQYMQLQVQLQQQTPESSLSQTQCQPQPVPQQRQHPPFPYNAFTLPNEPAGPPNTLNPSEPTSSANTLVNTPSPGAADQVDDDAPVALVEEKRRRNTAASARFRVKKKQWTLNLERSITDLSGRVEELEREAAELRRENGWLKEIVMLKSRRFGGSVPQLQPAPPSETLPSEGADEESEGSVESDTGPTTRAKGKEAQR